MKRSICTVLCVTVGAAAGARAQTANFDSFPEGGQGQVLTDNGVTFTNLDRRIDGDPHPAFWAIEDASGGLSLPGFSPPNCLAFGGWSPGPQPAYTRCGSFDVSVGHNAGAASMEVFDFGSDPGTTINLDAMLGGARVGGVTVNTIPGFQVHHYTVAFSGVTFDTVHFRIGPTDQDVIFALVDGVTIGAAPCQPDVNGDGLVNVQDFLAYLQLYAAADPRADFDNNGQVNVQDFLAFLQAFAAGCP
jgi:hypothetical protein